MPYHAHSLKGAHESRWQPLAQHLVAVANLAEELARDARPEDVDFALAARVAGLLHDLGKYRPEFQAMLHGAPKTEATRHKLAGAACAADRGRLDVAFAVAGHHGGLPDRATLRSGLNGSGGKDVVTRHWESAVQDCPELGRPMAALPRLENAHAFDFFTRLLFSCLVDADWQDTAGFYRLAEGRAAPPPSPSLEPAAALTRVLAYIKTRADQCRDAQIASIRNDILQASLAAAAQPPGLFAMTVPTGGGKTLSALAFALSHAARHGLRRVIYVAPYLSILEQNAREFRRALGIEDSSDFLFEHHSLADPLDKAENTQAEVSDSAQRAEAWDAPMIVTTNVQFFESLFANQPGRCRKLHNMARSVIVLDECQTLPPALVGPTCSMLSEFARQAGSSIVLCTATQPAWRRHERFPQGLAPVHEIAPAGLRLFTKLLRVRIEWPAQDARPLDWPAVATLMLEKHAILCVVNTKGAARSIHAELRRRGCDHAMHLSTNMCPRHRLQTIDEVRRRLVAGQPCRLVSTQLIEAGVDVDFPVVMRELAPLESIIQAAGRANREGLLNYADGTPGGRVTVFRGAAPVPLDRWYQAGIGVVERDFLRDGREPDIAQPEHIEEYFRRLYASGDVDAHKIEALRGSQSFQEVASSYQLIDDAGFSVVIATWEKARREVADLLAQLRAGWDPRLARRLAPYQVNVRYSQAEQYGDLIADDPAGIKVWWGPYDEQIGMTSELPSDWLIV
ncbi:MAG TPA: CRISPR-associated endonuclease Cas3'' [Pirellulales bacterium]|nr:CRISPR-associated endonuclease Cas3'' [Pirellulales bacterium]